MSFYNKYKEWIDQPAHVGMGFAVSAPLAYLYTPLGLISSLLWRVREWDQHKDEVSKWIFSRDLFFVDLGTVIGMLIWL